MTLKLIKKIERDTERGRRGFRLDNVVIEIIVFKPGLGIDPAKRPGPGFHGSTRVNPGQPKKIK
jgi:hypothetical protein